MKRVQAGLMWAFLIGPLLASQHVVVVMDDSGSMADRMRSNRRVRKIDAARDAIRTVLSRVPDEGHVGVLALNRGWILPLGPVDQDQIESAVKQLRAQGGTPLGASMKIATDGLLSARASERYGTYRLVIVTDGEAGDRELVDAYLPDIMSRGVLVDVIGVDMQADHSLATRVPSYRRADDPDALTKAIEEALAESDNSEPIAGESDFELLADFPAEMAPVMLSALTTSRDEPIVGGGVVVNESGHVTFSPSPRSGSSGGVRISSSTLTSTLGMLCLISVVVIGVTLVAFLKVISRR
jgi:uncharacterized protein YegL